jgi:hypothetical protein
VDEVYVLRGGGGGTNTRATESAILENPVTIEFANPSTPVTNPSARFGIETGTGLAPLLVLVEGMLILPVDLGRLLCQYTG